MGILLPASPRSSEDGDEITLGDNIACDPTDTVCTDEALGAVKGVYDFQDIGNKDRRSRLGRRGAQGVNVSLSLSLLTRSAQSWATLSATHLFPSPCPLLQWVFVMLRGLPTRARINCQLVLHRLLLDAFRAES